MMPNFGPRWQIIDPKPIGKGGQSHAYLVRDTEGNADNRYVVKVLNGIDDPDRRARLDSEIRRCRGFDHPNVVHLVDSGHTSKSHYPFLVLPYYSHGSLEDSRKRLPDDPVEILSFFAKICDGVGHVHDQHIVHRDIKPGNIFVTSDLQPIVGDFGISYREAEDRVTQSMEVVAPRWFGAPELRNGYLENPTQSADVYSLGKLLYWLFTGKVYDREEQDYGDEKRLLARIFDPAIPAYSFVDQLIAATVRYSPSDREIPGSKSLAGATRATIERVKANGHVLDLLLPQRCVFCARGRYRPAHDIVRLPGQLPMETWPGLENRRTRSQTPVQNQVDVYATIRQVAKVVIGQSSGLPLLLVCDYCGNVQHFRLDLTTDRHGGHWRP